MSFIKWLTLLIRRDMGWFAKELEHDEDFSRIMYGIRDEIQKESEGEKR